MYALLGSYGFSLGAAVGLGYVKLLTTVSTPASASGGASVGASSELLVITKEWVLGGEYHIVINGEKYEARPHLDSPYDAARLKIMA